MYKYIHLLFLVLMPLLAAAQNREYYYDYNTRYGTFRAYSNGGSRMISGIDYAAQIAESQRQTEAARQQRATESRQQVVAPGSAPRDYAREAREQAERQRRSEEELRAILAREKADKQKSYDAIKQRLQTLDDVTLRIWALKAMTSLVPKDEDLLQLYGLYAWDGDRIGAHEVEWRISKAYREAHNADFISMRNELFYRLGDFKGLYAMMERELQPAAKLQPLLRDSLDVMLALNAGIQTGSYVWVLQLLQTNEAPAFGLQHFGADARRAVSLLTMKNASQADKSAMASRLYAYAVARRESHVLDFSNLFLLNTAVRLDPKSANLREERFNSNSLLRCKAATIEDEEFFKQ